MFFAPSFYYIESATNIRSSPGFKPGVSQTEIIFCVPTFGYQKQHKTRYLGIRLETTWTSRAESSMKSRNLGIRFGTTLLEIRVILPPQMVPSPLE